MTRCFISLALPDTLIREISELQKTVTKKLEHEMKGFKASFTPVENLHITLKFLGEINKETVAEVEKRLQKINFAAFGVRLGKCGVFSPRIPRILWIELHGAEKLQQEIDRVLLGLFAVESQFMGHITLARIKYIPTKEAFNEYISGLSGSAVGRVKEFSLQKSTLSADRAVYETLETYYLK